jgi:hypothetical protein
METDTHEQKILDISFVPYDDCVVSRIIVFIKLPVAIKLSDAKDLSILDSVVVVTKYLQ